jgi:class 3 adenylate cyclase
MWLGLFLIPSYRSFVCRAALIFLAVLHFSTPVLCQDQRLADSLQQVYQEGEYEGEALLKLLYEIAFNQPDPERKLQYTDLLLMEADAAGSEEYLFNGYLQRGNALTYTGDLSEALESYFNAEALAQKWKSLPDLGRTYVAVAGVYSAMGNHNNTILYYTRAIEMLKNSGDSRNYAAALANLGDEYSLKLSKPDTALVLFRESEAIFEELNDKAGIANTLGNIGLAYAVKGDNETAEENISRAIGMLEELGDYYPISVYLTYISDIYAGQDNWEQAFAYAFRSLDLAKQYGLKEQIADANLKLSELYEKTGRKDISLEYYKTYVSLRDSVMNITAVQEMADLRTNFEVAQKQGEVDLLNQQKRTQRIIVFAVALALFLIGLLAFGLYRRNRYIKATNEIIEQEMNKSDTLLRNILPVTTAEELKLSGKVRAKKIDSVTVMFTDFKGFTRHSENLGPEVLVDTVDYYFSKFDTIIEKYGLEKIKTMGDSYMCAGGLPHPIDRHAQKMVQAAFEIVDFVIKTKEEAVDKEVRFDVRIGINTGTVVAGVVGTNKFAYDIWGDTVNIAARMESNSEPGKINVSENTYLLIKDEFECEYRGEIDVKNKGMMKMYFVKGPKGKRQATANV